MEQLLDGLMSKVGLDRETAMKVVDYIKENSDKIPQWIAESGLKDKIPGGLGKFF